MADSSLTLQQQLDQQKALNQRMERALEVARSGIFSWDETTRTYEWSAYFFELHGFAADKGVMTYEEYIDRIPEEDRAALIQSVADSREDRTPYEYTYRVRWPDGSIHWIGARGVWEYAEDGTPIRLFGVGFDADEQQRMELALKASEQRLRDAHDASQLGAWELNLGNLEVTVSEGFRKIHGIAQHTFDVRGNVLNIPQSDVHALYEGFAAVREGGEYDVEHRATHGQTGAPIWIRGRGRGRYDDEGNLIGVVGTNQDVTTRKHAEIAFLETARAFRALTQASPGLVFRADEQGQMTFVNQEQWVEISGLGPQAWQQDGWIDALHPADQSRGRQVWQAAVENAEPLHEEMRWRHVDGRIRWLLIQSQPVFDDQGVSSFVGTGTDVTALKKSERERATLQLALAESQKMEAIGTLAAGVAHDFNNFLAAVRGYVELARIKVTGEEGEAVEQARAYLREAESAIDQAKDVTNGLLTFSRGSKIEHEPLCLNTIIADNVVLLCQLVPASVKILCHLPNTEIWIEGDSTQLRQILVNLVINSRDALGEKGGNVDVTLGFENKWATILVQDSGRGMDPEERERAVEPFFTTKAQGQGTGLGLSVVHGIVTSHQGVLQIDSKRGVGTEIEIRFPLIEVRQGDTSEAVTAEIVTGHQRILLIEDNPLVRESCALRMEASGFSIVTAEDGEQGLLKLKALRDSVDLVLLDVDLPGANGVKVAAQMRQVVPDLPVIFVTGNDKSSALAEAVAEDLVVPKPIDFSLLFSAINQMAAQKEAAASATRS